MTYALRSPRGKLIEETASTDHTDAWVKAFDYLSDLLPAFAAEYWKRMRASQTAARRFGWTIVWCRLQQAPAVQTRRRRA